MAERDKLNAREAGGTYIGSLGGHVGASFTGKALDGARF